LPPDSLAMNSVTASDEAGREPRMVRASSFASEWLSSSTARTRMEREEPLEELRRSSREESAERSGLAASSLRYETIRRAGGGFGGGGTSPGGGGRPKFPPRRP